MAKKVTKKKIAKTGAKKKSPAAKTKKTASKTVKKKSTSKATAKKTAKKTVKKKVKKKTAAKKTASKPASKKKTAAAKSKAPAKKSGKKKAAKTKKASTSSNAGSNGKANKSAIKATTPTINRVVRPVPLTPTEPLVEDWTPLSDAKLRKIKTELSRKDLNNLKKLLLEKRAELVGDVLNMEQARSSGNGGDLSNMPLHMADVGSDNYEQEFTLGLVESERKLLIEIDAALLRIKNRIYGICIVSGTLIPPARLEIKPWAKYSIEVVREREKLGLHSF